MCCDGGFSRRRSSSDASPASHARASCVAWLSGVTRSDTPARSNAWFISAAHASPVSSSHARRLRTLALPRAPGRRVAGRWRPPGGTTALPPAAPRRSPAPRTPSVGAGCRPPPPSSSGRRAPPACRAARPPSRAPRSSAPDPAAAALHPVAATGERGSALSRWRELGGRAVCRRRRSYAARRGRGALSGAGRIGRCRLLALTPGRESVNRSHRPSWSPIRAGESTSPSIQSMSYSSVVTPAAIAGRRGTLGCRRGKIVPGETRPGKVFCSLPPNWPFYALMPPLHAKAHAA